MVRVIYDIEESDYFYKINNLKFYFTSVFNQRRFINNFKYYVKEETFKLQSKYHINIDITNYLLVAFYKKIEKRGFKVLAYYPNGAIIELKEDYVFKMN